MDYKRRTWLALGALGGLLGASGQEPIPVREMNVRQGPETVFERPPAEIFAALDGASATGENGRVGSELVFWGFDLRDGRSVFLFACARRPGFDCATRIPAICPVATTVLETGEANGKTVHRECRNIAVASPGDTRPGCSDRVQDVSLGVGLVSCG